MKTGGTSGPFTYEDRAYERVGSTTRRMSQAKYEKALLDRDHPLTHTLLQQGHTIEEVLGTLFAKQRGVMAT